MKKLLLVTLLAFLAACGDQPSKLAETTPPPSQGKAAPTASATAESLKAEIAAEICDLHKYEKYKDSELPNTLNDMEALLNVGKAKDLISQAGSKSEVSKDINALKQEIVKYQVIMNPKMRIHYQKFVHDLFSELEMVPVEGGTFAMGGNEINDGKPIHNVTVSNFAIAKYETTQEVWQKIMGSNPSSHNLGSKPIVLIQFPCMDCPVDRISWDDVQVFIKKLNTLTGKNYRLPTEAEWEYAARGGKHSKNFEYSGSNDIKEVAWTSLDSGSNTHPVGQKKANELGLYDMSGNVYEWCEDWYDENYYKKSPAKDPKCVTVGEFHVSRGGNWSNPPVASGVAARFKIKIGWRWIGFRLATSLDLPNSLPVR